MKKIIINILTVILLVGLTVFGAYVYVERRDWQHRIQYHYYAAQLRLHFKEIKCDANAPSWLKKTIIQNIQNFEAYASQVSYISPDKQQFTCAAGGKTSFDDANKITKDTRFVYASITKALTSALILEQVKHAALDLNDKAFSFAHENKVVDERINSILIIDLMRHQAGFDRYVTGEPMFQQKDQVWCPKNLNRLSEIELQYPPGEQAIYSNLGYCLLGAVIERQTQLEYRQLAMSFLNKSVPDNHFKFIDQDYLEDEVGYDDFYNYIPDFRLTRDMQALSAVSGLSGRADELARLYQYFVSEFGKEYIFNQDVYQCRNGSSCSRGVLMQKLYKDGFQVYANTGNYPGFTGYALVDERGGVLVGLSNGYTSEKKRNAVIDEIRLSLQNEYLPLIK